MNGLVGRLVSSVLLHVDAPRCGGCWCGVWNLGAGGLVGLLARCWALRDHTSLVASFGSGSCVSVWVAL